MFEKPSKLNPALIAGLAIGVVSGLPGLNLINCCCCAGIILGGMLAVHLYKQEFTGEMPPMESSDALVLGIMAGIVGAVSSVVVGGLVTVLFGGVEERFIMKFLEEFFSRMEESGGMPPGSVDELMEQMERSFEESRTFGGILRNLFFSLIIYPIFAMLGGLIGYGLLVKKKPAGPSQQAQA